MDGEGGVVSNQTATPLYPLELPTPHSTLCEYLLVASHFASVILDFYGNP